MRLLCLLVFIALLGFSRQDQYSVNYNMESQEVMATTPIVPTVLELQSGGYSFKINNIGLGGPPYFTLNDQPYYVLGSLNCTDTQNPIYNATTGVWFCGTFLGYNASTSAGTLASLTCSAGSDLQWDTTLGGFKCSTDSDTAAALACANNQVPRWDLLSAQWICSTDNDFVGALNCPSGNVLQFTGTWGCFAPSDANLLSSLTIACSNPNFLLTMNGLGQWSCAQDVDTLGSLSCSTGQIIKYTSIGSPVCGTDEDTVRDLNCPMGSTIILNGTVQCIPAPLTNVAPPTAFVDGQLLATSASTTFVSQNTYFGSTISRDLAPFKYPQGFVAIAYGFVLTRNPSSIDTKFNISVQLISASSNAVVSELWLPAGATSASTTTGIAFPPLSSGLNVHYNVVGLKSQTDIGITTTLILSINNPV